MRPTAFATPPDFPSWSAPHPLMAEWLNATPSGTPGALWALARAYYVRCERYDRTVCTGPILAADGIMPAAPSETAMINRNAAHVLIELEASAVAAGHTAAEFRAARKSYVLSSEWGRDLANLDAVVL